VKLTKDI